jgi:uncharacterized protein YjbJ (UPF0337 family)
MADTYDKGTENRVEGKVDEVKGRVRNAVGGATGDTSEQLKGKAEELKGKAKQSIGGAQQDADRDRDV